jgi:hypothetical protein
VTVFCISTDVFLLALVLLSFQRIVFGHRSGLLFIFGLHYSKNGMTVMLLIIWQTEAGGFVHHIAGGNAVIFKNYLINIHLIPVYTVTQQIRKRVLKNCTRIILTEIGTVAGIGEPDDIVIELDEAVFYQFIKVLM